MRILLTGRTGQVGWELERSLAGLGEIVALDRRGMNLLAPDEIRAAVRRVSPDIVVNAAAYTAVDRAESEPEVAHRVNGLAPGILAEEAGRAGALLVHYSTDYVFDGTKEAPYVEDDLPNPVNVYGRSKLAGEEAVRASGCHHLIFRTSWVYSARGSNFVLTLLKLAGERAELRIVDDQVGAPTWARAIAIQTASVLADPAQARQRSGVYHLASAGEVSWCGFGRAIFEEAARLDPAFRAPLVTPIPSSEYPRPARRPANSRLDITRLGRAFGLHARPWRADLAACLKEWTSARSQA